MQAPFFGGGPGGQANQRERVPRRVGPGPLRRRRLGVAGGRRPGGGRGPVAFTSVVTTSFFAGVVACHLFPPLRASLDEAARRRELSRKVRSLSGRQLGMLRSLVDGEWLRAPVGDVGAEALVSLGLADRSRIGFGFDGDCLTLGLRYAAELRGDPDRWLAR